jgi:bifunctional polynucleotide phosphatase/kinase
MKKIQIKVKVKLMIKSHQSVYYTQTDIISKKLALFDLDGTLVKTVSGHRFAQSENDWQLMYDNVPDKIAQYHTDGYKIIVVTNQFNVPIESLRDKFEGLQRLTHTPIEFYVATKKDTYRKPMTDLWDFILSVNHLSAKMIDQASFYCGDAAGRAKNYLPGKVKDFNITDRYFAHNIGLTFYTPEQVFLNRHAFNYVDPYLTELDLQLYVPKILDHTFTHNKNLVIMVGPQASGKTKLSRSDQFVGYTHLNNDLIKNMTKLKKQFINEIDQEHNIIIDNTNPTPETRSYYVGAAKLSGYKIYCYFFDLPIILSKHLNQMRAQITHNLVPAIPMVALYTYYKHLVAPVVSEGFDEIFVIKTPIIDPDILGGYYFYHYDLK